MALDFQFTSNHKDSIMREMFGYSCMAVLEVICGVKLFCNVTFADTAEEKCSFIQVLLNSWNRK